MLRFYDTLRTASLLALAAAGGALTAQADAVCDLSDGYGQTLTAYVGEVEACLASSEAFTPDLEDAVFAMTNAARADKGVDALERRTSLDKAARAHALDMAARNFAGHSDLEGRGHDYRMRAIDREVLAGATGANVVVMKAGASAGEVYEMIRADEANRKNLTRGTFTDTGLGIAQSGDRLYVVQMLTTVDGELENPLPLAIADGTSFRPKMTERLFRTAGWNLTDADGNRLAGSRLMRMNADSLDTVETAYLDFLVELDADTYVLKGPLVSKQ